MWARDVDTAAPSLERVRNNVFVFYTSTELGV